MSHQLWGGRFATPTADDMRQFNDSFRFDRRLADADITGSVAWAQALAAAHVITDVECATLVHGLNLIRREFAEGRFLSAPGDEDIHTAVERRLLELVGPVAGKLHTGRSRNDQVATDMRIFCIEAGQTLQAELCHLQQAFLHQAEQHTTTLMPGYTHLQRAQPITFGHWCLAYVEMFERDRQRLADAIDRTRSLPLGVGALAGNSLGVDRSALAAQLVTAQGEIPFTTVAANSLDAVADRDFVVELLFDCAMIGMHLSRMAEDLILYSSAEYGFIELADEYSTGSSLMPQKKNPDSMELLRGKSGRLIGNLVTLLTVLKGTPLAYNKDLQEDKEPLFDSLDTLQLGLRVAAAAVMTLVVHPKRMAAALDDAMLATDLADELVRRGVPFREAHGKIGQLVRQAMAQGVSLRQLPLEAYQAVHTDLDPSIYALFDFTRSVMHKNSLGGTAPERVAEQVAAWRQRLVRISE